MLKQDSMLAELGDQMNVWVGPAQVIVASNMPDHRDMYNMCFVTEEEAGCQGEWHVLGDLEHLKAKFRHFDSKVQKLLELADPKECYIWRLSQMPALPTWKSANGRLVLVGDSAHAMLPYAGLVCFFFGITITGIHNMSFIGRFLVHRGRSMSR